EVENDRPASRVEHAIAPDAVRGDTPGRAGHQIEAIRPGRSEHRAEVVGAETRAVEEAVVERQSLRRVVAERARPVAVVNQRGEEEAVHLSTVELRVACLPVLRRRSGRGLGELKRSTRVAGAVRLRVSGRWAVPGRLY